MGYIKPASPSIEHSNSWRWRLFGTGKKRGVSDSVKKVGTSHYNDGLTGANLQGLQEGWIALRAAYQQGNFPNRPAQTGPVIGCSEVLDHGPSGTTAQWRVGPEHGFRSAEMRATTGYFGFSICASCTCRLSTSTSRKNRTSSFSKHRASSWSSRATAQHSTAQRIYLSNRLTKGKEDAAPDSGCCHIPASSK